MIYVAQLQELNAIMKAQWQALPEARTAAIWGIAGGNGLEHAGNQLQTIYGIDLNLEYLQACEKRYRQRFGERLKLLQLDLTEYVGIENFCRLAAQSQAKLVSCVIQQQSISQTFVSQSPYQAQFQNIGQLHQDIDRVQLIEAFAAYNYSLILETVVQLPAGKTLARLDFSKA